MGYEADWLLFKMENTKARARPKEISKHTWHYDPLFSFAEFLLNTKNCRKNSTQKKDIANDYTP